MPCQVFQQARPQPYAPVHFTRSFPGNGSLKINWCALCCTPMSQGPLKWVEKSPSISKGSEAGPEHAETVVNFTLGRQRRRASERRGGRDSQGLTPATPPVGMAAGEVAGGDRASVRPPGAKWQPASQHGVHAAAVPRAGAYLLLDKGKAEGHRKKIICPSSKWGQTFSLGKSSNCEVVSWETTFARQCEARGRYISYRDSW